MPADEVGATARFWGVHKNTRRTNSLTDRALSKKHERAMRYWLSKS